jgi:hypothetical protein
MRPRERGEETRVEDASVRGRSVIFATSAGMTAPPDATASARLASSVRTFNASAFRRGRFVGLGGLHTLHQPNTGFAEDGGHEGLAEHPLLDLLDDLALDLVERSLERVRAGGANDTSGQSSVPGGSGRRGARGRRRWVLKRRGHGRLKNERATTATPPCSIRRQFTNAVASTIAA